MKLKAYIKFLGTQDSEGRIHINEDDDWFHSGENYLIINIDSSFELKKKTGCIMVVDRFGTRRLIDQDKYYWGETTIDNFEEAISSLKI